MQWYPRACPVCAGDLHDDLQDRGWVTCFLCARSFDIRDAPPGDLEDALFGSSPWARVRHPSVFGIQAVVPNLPRRGEPDRPADSDRGGDSRSRKRPSP